MYAETRIPNLVSWRFQSNHQRGYFCRKRSIMATAAQSTPPDSTTMAESPACHVGPDTRLRRIMTGMAVNGLKNVVSRFSSRCG